MPDGSGTADLTLSHALADHTLAKVCRFVVGMTWDYARDSSTADIVTCNSEMWDTWRGGGQVHYALP
jgi:hypothetical protein